MVFLLSLQGCYLHPHPEAIFSPLKAVVVRQGQKPDNVREKRTRLENAGGFLSKLLALDICWEVRWENDFLVKK